MSSKLARQRKRTNATGRTEGGDHFHVRLYAWLMDSQAWAALTVAERCVYIEVERKFFGDNNGRIGMGVRAVASACHISKNTANRCFHRLVELGFLECRTPGGFSRKDPHASEWRLTRARCDVTGEAPTKAFMRWSAPAATDAKRGPKIGTARSQIKDSTSARAA